MSEIATKETAESKLLKSSEKEKLEVDKVDKKTPEKSKKPDSPLKEPVEKEKSSKKEDKNGLKK